jgi:hypothetical protein
MKYFSCKDFLKIFGVFVFQIQKLLVYTSFSFFKIFVREDKDLWVVGVQEIANYLNFIANSIPKKYTVNIVPNKYYLRNHYNFQGFQNKWINSIIIMFYLPILFGYLVAKSNNFIYCWNSGFLINEFDGRDFEFSFLKKNGKSIILLFLGSDIRSLELSLAHGKNIGQETAASNLFLIRPDIFGEKKEYFLKMIARSADKYADHVFNAKVDQISYLEKEANPFLYFYPDEKFQKNDGKFESLNIIKIIHAPSSPIIKGTPIVRSIIKKLQEDGYKFDYQELMNVDNQEVINCLRDTHIVVNELYAFMPGVLAIEAMAAHCAVLTSGDPDIETFPQGADKAWFRTRYWELYDHLKYLLDHHQEIKKYADQGYEWAWNECRTTISRQKFLDVIGRQQ